MQRRVRVAAILSKVSVSLSRMATIAAKKRSGATSHIFRHTGLTPTEPLRAAQKSAPSTSPTKTSIEMPVAFR